MGQEAEAADDITVGVQNDRFRHHAGSSPERRSGADHGDSCVVLVDIRELNRPETSLLKASDAVDSNDELTGNLRHLSIGDSIAR
jgi:ERCC4-type nuclease